MSSNSNTKTIIQQTPPDLQGQAKVDLRKRDFDAIVWQKGYEVYLDKALRCPCRNLNDKQALSSCKNCGGSGWVYLNRYKTRMVLQSMNLDTKFKEWSEERIGVVKITAMNRDELSYMDRITLIEATAVSNDVLYPQMYFGELRARVNYDIQSIDEFFLFQGNSVVLKKLQEGVDYDILLDTQGENTNLLRFNQIYQNILNLTVSIRYRHAPTYHVLDITRQVISTRELDKTVGADVVTTLPISAMGRRSHYVLDEQNYSKDYLLDNSYLVNGCAVHPEDKPDIPQNFRIEHPVATSVILYWDDVSNEDLYVVQRKSALNNAWVQIASLPANTTTYTDNTTLPSTTYYYRVAARKVSGQSPWSEEIGITTNP